MSTATPQLGVSGQPGAAQGADREAILSAVVEGLGERPYTLPAWLFYDARGSELFEQITSLPEYYLTRTERGILKQHAAEMLQCAAGEPSQTLVFLELGAGTAAKSGVLLRAAVARQGHALYLPVDVSASALEEGERTLRRAVPGVTIEPQVANYLSEPLRIRRPHGARVMAMYIGSSIGNFDPPQARELLRHLRSQLERGDSLLLGTDLAPGAPGNASSTVSSKDVSMLRAAYDDAAGVTAAFNLNILARLNFDLGADFDLADFGHEARWNVAESRIEMHLVARRAVEISIPTEGDLTLPVKFRAGESIHTENSYKYTVAKAGGLLSDGGFAAERVWTDPQGLFAVTLARAM